MTVRNKRKLDPFMGIGWQMFFGGLILYLASWITGQQVSLSTVPMATWGWIAYLTSIGSIACFLCYLYALKHLPISLVSIYVYLNPLVALLLGILFLNEKLTWSIVMGAMLIFVGIYIVMKSRSVKKRLN